MKTITLDKPSKLLTGSNQVISPGVNRLTAENSPGVRTVILTKPGNYIYTLSEAGTELVVLGRFWLKGQETLDLNLTLIHAAKHTSARVSLKAVVEGRGVANLNGTIIVQKNAQNTHSFLEERVLLLGSKASATAIPNLEIEANDVKCSHAAAIGKINDEELFYLQTRGLSKLKATRLLAKGFLS